MPDVLDRAAVPFAIRCRGKSLVGEIERMLRELGPARAVVVDPQSGRVRDVVCSGDVPDPKVREGAAP